jgi:unsaturated chondroitin disaccharide hydrolase
METETRQAVPAPLTADQARAALHEAVAQVRINLPLYTSHCQNNTSVNGIYPACENTDWTCGFWPGEIWLSYENTGDLAFRHAAEVLVESFETRIRNQIEVDHHDMGFLYTPSCVAAYKLTGNVRARDAAVLAAKQLESRFQPKGQFLQAWGAMNEPGNYRFIIDCLLNVPLLYWASEVTGDAGYADIAGRHTATCLAYSFRPDGSTWHTFFMNPDGTPSHGATAQGYSDESFWARGQAWGIYGSALSYRATKKPEFLEAFRRALAFYLTRLPQDLVPYWDMIFTSGGEPRDSSAAAIAACGMLEAAKYLPEAEAGQVSLLAARTMGSLARDYAVKQHVPGAGQILHGTYSKKSPYNTCSQTGVDECTSWGDYFYMEALTRMTCDWKLYW